MYEVNSPVESALTHFAGLGLAAIAEDVQGSGVRLRWSDTGEPRMQIETSDPSTSVPSALGTACRRLRDADGWVFATTELAGKATGTFSPRVKIGDDDWGNLEDDRRRHLNDLYAERHWVDLKMIASLGRPAYWRIPVKSQGIDPDQGASRWEMKERNHGQEFMQHRFRRLVESVAQLDDAEIDAALHGDLKSNTVTSATGFANYGYHHAALVLAALWGISCFPVAHRKNAQSATACAFKHGVRHSTSMLLPISLSFRTLTWWESIIKSAGLNTVGEFLAGAQSQTDADDVLRVAAASSWLAEQGVTAVIRFPIEKRGSDSAPQRIVLDGTILAISEFAIR